MAVNGLNSPSGITPGANQLREMRGVTSQPDFREALETLKSDNPKVNAAGPEAIRFSNHAVDRMRSRGISFTPDQLNKIDQAVQKAQSKGSKNTLLLMGDNALIVSVKDKTVVTVLDRPTMKDNVFTNIDSTVVI